MKIVSQVILIVLLSSQRMNIEKHLNFFSTVAAPRKL